MSFTRFVVSRLPSGIKSTIRTQLFRLLKITEPQEADSGSVLRIKSFGRFKVAYRDNTADEKVLAFDPDIFFTSVDYQPAETDVILDVGAHIGTFAIVAASRVSRGKVYAIEACEDTFNYLHINAALNGSGNLSTFHLALSDHRGICTLYYETENQGHSIVAPLWHGIHGSESVECCTLEQFFNERHVNKCNFIKFNCEGAEFPILLSSSPTLLKRIDKMLVLYHCDLWTKNTAEELVAHLQLNGFECNIINRTETRGWIIATNTALRQ